MINPINPIMGLRFGEDTANGADPTIGECPYQVFLVTQANASVDYDTLYNGPAPLQLTRILIADGYRVNLAIPPSDGYLYPMVIEEDTNVLMASQGNLTTKHVLLGPLVLPYSINGINGGTDPAIFSPGLNGNENLQYWMLLIGPGIIGGNGQGNYYDIDEIRLDLMNNINYYLLLSAAKSMPAS